MDPQDNKLYRAYALIDEFALAVANYRRMVQYMETKVKKLERLERKGTDGTKRDDCHDCDV